MTSKVVLKLAEEVLDRGFREAEGEVDRKIDLSFLLDDLGTSFEKADPALEYLQSRGLIRSYTGDAMFLSELGVKAISDETDIKTLPKYQREWPQQPVADTTPEPSSAGGELRRPYRATVSFVGADGQRVEFELGWVTVIGRSDEADFTLPDPRASKKHVELKYVGDRYLLKDLGSANGTMVNNNYVDVHPLVHGDVVLVGRTEVLYTCPEVIQEPVGEPPAPSVPPAPPRRPPVEALGATERPEPSPEPARPLPEPSRPPREPSRPASPPMVASARGEPAQAQRPELRGEVSRSGPAARPEPGKKMAMPEARRSPATPAPTPAPDPVRIVKGRPEARPAAPAESDLFAAPRPPATDLFGDDEPKTESGPVTRPGDDLFSAPPASELFDEDTPKRGTPVPKKADLFAAADDGPGDLFAADYAASVPRGGPSLFDEAKNDDLFGETVVRPKGSSAPVSPLPLSTRAKPPEDILPPIDVPLDELAPEPALDMLEPIEDQINVDDVGDQTVAALQNPLLDEKPTGRTAELPVWGPGGKSDDSLPAYGQAPFEERTPVEGSAGSGGPPEALLAESRDLPEAPEAIDDSGSSLPQIASDAPVPFQSFLETLSVLRGRISDAGIPDQARVLDAIDLLRKHPSVRAALTE